MQKTIHLGKMIEFHEFTEEPSKHKFPHQISVVIGPAVFRYPAMILGISDPDKIELLVFHHDKTRYVSEVVFYPELPELPQEKTTHWCTYAEEIPYK